MIAEALLAAAVAKAVPMQVRLKDGAAWTITSERAFRTEREGQTLQNWSLRSERRLTWRKATFTRPAELLVTPVSATAGEGSTPDLLATHTFPGPVAVEVDFQLKPVRFADEKAVRAKERELAGTQGKEPGWRTDASAMARIAPELAIVARAQSFPLVPGKPYEYQPDVPGPMMGLPVKARSSFLLEAHDPAAGRAVVAWRQTIDPAAVRQSAGALAALVRKTDPAKADAAAELQSLEWSRDETCRYEIDLPTGLAVRTECQAAVQSGRDRIVDRWTITQTLPEPR